MNAPLNPMEVGFEKYAIGQPVPRKEDPVLVRGLGNYTDDQNLPGQAYAVMVRSTVAHGRILSIEAEEARAMPGVLGIWPGADIEGAGFGPMPSGMDFKNRDGSPMPKPTQPPLTTDKVRFVGDPVAVVVAETRAQAQDAAEMVV